MVSVCDWSVVTADAEAEAEVEVALLFLVH